jgi:hypothetical protein
MKVSTNKITAAILSKEQRLKNKEDILSLKDKVDAFYGKHGHYNINNRIDPKLTFLIRRLKYLISQKTKYIPDDLVTYLKKVGVLKPVRTSGLSDDEILDKVYKYYKKYNTYNIEQRKDKTLYNILLNIKKGRRRISNSLKRRLDSLNVQNKKKGYRIVFPNSRKVNEVSVRKLLILYFDKYKSYDVVNRMGFTGLYSFIQKVKNNKVDISKDLRKELQAKGVI